MPVSLAYSSQLTVTEEIADPQLNVNARKVTHSGLDVKNAAYKGDSSVAVSKVASFTKALTAVAATIDLRALVGTNGGAVDANGLKVQFVKFRNPLSNANPITIEPGETNGYELFGAAFSLTLKPGQEILAALNDSAPDVDGTHKTLDLAGTGTQALECSIVVG